MPRPLLSAHSLILGLLIQSSLIACGGGDNGAGSSEGGVGGAAATGATINGTGGASTGQGGTKAFGGAMSSTGGAAAGGQATQIGAGGTEAGGTASTGGSNLSVGGATIGGHSAGETASGGASTGGRATAGTATGGSSSTDCNTPPAASALVGWASVSGNSVSTTTGGGNATPTVVTTLSQLQTAAMGTTAAVIYVKGVLSNGDITVGSNKTIVGLCGAEIHGHVELSGSVNVMIRNIKIVGYAVGNCALDPSYDSGTGCSSGADAISVQKNAHHIWFDHCDVSDGTDGNLDITNGANYVTVSWTKFHYTTRTDSSGSDSTGAAGHRYSNLVGGTDTPSTYDDANSLNVTWHHNWWADSVMERMPRVRFGKNHLFNNLWSASGNNYCVRAGLQAQILIENGVFSGVKSPHVFNSTTDQATAYITADAAKNAYTNTSGTKATGGGGAAFATPSYPYTMDTLSNVESLVRNGAGPK